jgi:hypothetical protein
MHTANWLLLIGLLIKLYVIFYYIRTALVSFVVDTSKDVKLSLSIILLFDWI